jgi:hypothetical protein
MIKNKEFVRLVYNNQTPILYVFNLDFECAKCE